MKKMFQSPNFGLLFLRILVGLTMIYFSVRNIQGGLGTLKYLGSSMGLIGIHFAPLFWGIMSITVTTVGSLFVILGLFFRIACGFLTFNMAIAVLTHVSKADAFKDMALAVVIGGVFLSLMFVGAGRFAIDKD